MESAGSGHEFTGSGIYENETVELYRLDSDPGEEIDLAARRSENSARMMIKLKPWRGEPQRISTSQPGGWDQFSKSGEEWHALFRQFMQERQDSYSKRSSAAE